MKPDRGALLIFAAPVRDYLHSADSMAWSYHARRNGRNPNDWREAKAFEEKIASQRVQMGFLI